MRRGQRFGCLLVADRCPPGERHVTPLGPKAVRRLVPAAVLALTLVPALLVGTGAGAATPRSVAISWVVDIAMVASSDGGAGFFSPAIRQKLRSDLSIGNLEGTLAVGGSSKCGPSSTDCFVFRAPPSYARLLRGAGFTLMNVANHHAYDYGAEGQRETLAALRSNGCAGPGSRDRSRPCASAASAWA